MANTIVDAKGRSCPEPVVMAKKALLEIAMGEVMTLLVDNEVSKTNVENFLQSKKCTVETEADNGVFRITASKTAESAVTKPDFASSDSGPEKHVIAIKGNRMGDGSDELGEILIRAFINTIGEIEPLPSAVIFYNSGIEFCLNGSPVLESLQELDKRGVAIVVCGTCVQYFYQKKNVAIGTVSNMYDIMELLSRARSVVSP